MILARWSLLLIVCQLGTSVLASDGPSETAAPEVELPVLRRGPIALALVDGDRVLLVANERSGTISVLDLASGKVVHEFPVGESLSDIRVLASGRHVVTADRERHELVLLRMESPRDFFVLQRVSVRSFPVSIQVAPEDRRCTVASLWSRSLSVIDISWPHHAGDPVLSMVHETALPFAAGAQLLLPNATKVLVADAFGGMLAVVDSESGLIESTREIPGHNIRGLALSKDKRLVHVAQNLSDPRSSTDRFDITWGIVAASTVQTLATAAVIDPHADILNGSWVEQIGGFGNGVADPAGIARVTDGRLVITAAGVDAVTFVDPQTGTEKLLPVGDRPTAIIAGGNRRRVYVANTFSDTISVIDTAHRQVVGEISLGPSPPLSAAERGERLFYDAHLSADSWFSCHSCHTDGHTSGQLADTLGDGGFGNPKQVLSLLGVRDTPPYAWDGSIERLEDQLDKSVRTSMHGRPLADEQLADLSAFLKTLAPPPAMDEGSTAPGTLERGAALFVELNCQQCHAPPAFTAKGTFDVGLVDETHNNRFNPPSLRGVGHRTRLFHDGRAVSLEEVFARFGHQLERELTNEERADLVRYLKSL